MPLDHILVGVFVGLLGIAGLFFAAGAQDGYMYFAGLAVFLGAVFFNVRNVVAYCNKKWPH